MSKAALIIVLFIPFFSHGFGFSRSGEFRSAAIAGRLTVSCPGVVANFNCRDLVLDPSPMDRFHGPAATPANVVEFVNVAQDGETRSRAENYDGASGVSAPVNLWQSELFQKPLLKEGRNRITFRLLRSGREYGAGTFVLDVVRGQNRTCRTASFTSQDPDDCRSQYTLCHQYFEQAKYCN